MTAASTIFETGISTAALAASGLITITNTTTASSSIAGAVVIGNGTSATSVAIGGGRIFAGGSYLSSWTTGNGNGYTFDCNRICNSTVDGAHYVKMFSGTVRGNITTGKANSGSWNGLYLDVIRNYIETTDAGTLAESNGMYCGYGQYNTSALTPITTASNGLQLKSYALSGTITTLTSLKVTGLTVGAGSTVTTNYGINIGASTATGTLTNDYGLYIGNRAGATLSYAIYTNAGLVFIGDKTTIQAALPQLEVKNASGAAQIVINSSSTTQSTSIKFQAGGVDKVNVGSSISGGFGLFVYDATNANYVLTYAQGAIGACYWSFAGTLDASSITAASLVSSGGAAFAKSAIVGQSLHCGVLNTATAAGTSTLTIASRRTQVFTGTTTQTVQLPAANAAGATIGIEYIIKNRSTGDVTITRAGSDTIEGNTSVVVAGGMSAHICSDGVSEWEIV